jgi:hypothetical protein
MSVDQPHIGVGWAFPPRWSTRGDAVVAGKETGEAKVRQSMELIIRTDLGERRMRPRFGADASRFVFEPSNGTSVEQLAYVTERALRLWEPRILVDAVRAERGVDDGRIDIVVEFRTDRHRKPSNLVVPYYLESVATQSSEVAP